jgi:uncharacterized oxidoreductase
MKIENSTILITGGGTGLGLSLAQMLTRKGNTIIICGRSIEKLKQAKEKIPELITYQCDVSDDQSINSLVETIIEKHSSLNVLINNAGVMHLHDVVNDSLPIRNQKAEVMTNFYGVVALCNKLIPLLKTKEQSAILNITSGLAYMPFMASPVYAATKAAVHSYSQSIRQALKKTSIDVFEVLPPMVDTQMSKDLEMPGMKKMSSETLAKIIIKAMSKDQFEIRPGMSAMMINMYKYFPWLINTMMMKMSPKILLNLPKYE